MLHRNNPVQPWSPPMNAKPQPGARAVGGATPHPWEALAILAADNSRLLARRLSAAHPFNAAAAVLAWHANQAVTHSVSASYALAEAARKQAQAIAAAGERDLPDGPLRAACAAVAKLQVHFADVVARWALGFGRRFGHLAFAFPPAGS
jgi:hypothetical protein